MSIITFWNNTKEQTGKTISIAAICTYMAIEHNYRILIISTGINNKTLDNCFFPKPKVKKNMGIFGPNTNLAMEDGIEGLSKMMRSNKLSPDIITNYTKTVFKERLEVLQAYVGEKSLYQDLSKIYPEIINLANQYYDLVFVDLDLELDKNTIDTILANSNLVINTVSQRISSINNFMEQYKKNTGIKTAKNLILIGRYDKYSKYSVKNISRYIGEKNKILCIPYNTLFFEACEEASVPELFLKLRRSISEDDRNSIFILEVQRAAQNIIYRLQNLQVKL